MEKLKNNIITFKADRSLIEALDGIENRSEFIRIAILMALKNICPLCNGTGVLTADQQKHWESFNKHHLVQKCPECFAPVIVCKHEDSEIECV